METFKLDCALAESEASAIQKLADELTSIGEEIQQYELPEDSELNYTTPRSAIAANVLNSAEKMSNTAKILNTVVEKHTELQNNLTFDMYVEEQERKEQEQASKANASSGSSGSSGYYSSAAAYSAAGAYYSENSTTLAETYGVTENTQVELEPDPGLTEKKNEEENKDKENKLGEIKNTIKFGAELIAPTIGYILSEDTNKKIDERIENKYDEKNGFAILDDKYVVRCDETIGKVGDIIVITTASGATYNCIIGETYKAEEGKENTFEFFTNSKEGIEPTKDMPNKDDGIVQVDNYGSSDEKKFKEVEKQTETNTEEKENKETETKENTETKTEDETTKTDENQNGGVVEDQNDVISGYEGLKKFLDTMNAPKVSIGGGEQTINVTNSQQPQTPSQSVSEPVTQEPVYNWESNTPEVTTSGTESVTNTGISTSTSESNNSQTHNFSGGFGYVSSSDEEEKQKDLLETNYNFVNKINDGGAK